VASKRAKNHGSGHLITAIRRRRHLAI